jgi:protease secretion system outer membrane protein
MTLSYLRSKTLMATALGAAFLLPCTGVSAMGLMQAYEAALKNDPAYRAAFYSSEAGKENKIQARAGLLPNLSASVGGGRNHSDIIQGSQPMTQQDYTSKSRVLQLRQTVVNFDALARYKQGVLQEELSNVSLLSETQQVALRVVGAYVEVLYKQDQLAVAKAERDTYVERMKVNDRMYAKGEGTRTDMLETRARLDVAEAAVLDAQDNLAAARTTLEGIVGGPIGELEPLAPQFRSRPMEAKSFDEWKKIMLDNSYDIRSRRLNLDINQQEVNKQRAGHFPRLDVSATYSKSLSESVNTINTDYTTRSIGFQLNIPLYSGGAVNSATRQAVANREKAREDMQAEIDKQTIELRKDYDQLASAVPRIEALMKAVDSGKLLVTATEQSIRGGVRINLDLLDAQRQLSNTQRDLAQARYTYVLTYLKLRAAAGQLSAADVREMAAYFR